MEVSSYAEALWWGVEHALVMPTVSEEARQAQQRLAEEKIEPELIAATTNEGRFVPSIILKQRLVRHYKKD
jgi:hypothetical protein